MSAKGTEQQALSHLNALERYGKSVSRVTIEGKKIEFELARENQPDEFDRLDMRHGKT